MTIDEAIRHAEEVAEENQAIVDACDYYGDNMAKCEECAKEHRQLARWLRELKTLKEQQPKTEGARGDIPLQQTIPKMPQPKVGHWIGADGTTVYVNSEGNVTESRDKGEAVKCSECGEWLVGSDEYVCGGRYCPSCGIKMEAKNDKRKSD